jgi:hypothetical protein
MSKLRLAVAAIFLSGIHTPSQAQSCSWLISENQRLRQEATELAEYEWGSALVFGGCALIGMDTYNQTGSEEDALAAVAACAASGCALTTSYTNCLRVNATLFLYALRGSGIEDEIRRRC